MSRVYRTREQWRELIAEFEQSDLSQKDFCEPRGINPAYFSQRRLELQRDAEDNGTGFALAMPQSATSQQTVCKHPGMVTFKSIFSVPVCYSFSASFDSI